MEQEQECVIIDAIGEKVIQELKTEIELQSHFEVTLITLKFNRLEIVLKFNNITINIGRNLQTMTFCDEVCTINDVSVKSYSNFIINVALKCHQEQTEKLIWRNY